MVDIKLAQELTLSIVSHSHGFLLHRLLDDLAGCTSLHGARVIITLNVPEELDVTRWPMLQLLVLCNDQPRGFGENHNQAFRYCNTRWYAVLNPDLRLPSDIFPKLIYTAKSKSKLGVIAPVITNSKGHPEDAVRSNITPLSLMLRVLLRCAGKQQNSFKLSDRDEGRIFWLAGMFLVFDATAYREVSGFDERFFLYCEDYDICIRLLRFGYQLQQERSVSAVHDAQRDSQKSIKHLRWHITSLFRVWTSSVFWWTLIRK